MDKSYKASFQSCVMRMMSVRCPAFKRYKLRRGIEGYEVFVGALLYRSTIDSARAAWVVWQPGPGVERYFNVYLGWSLVSDALPYSVSRDERLYSASEPVPGVVGACLDLEAVERKQGVGGITIPSPWDQLLEVKASAPKAVMRDARIKARREADALSTVERDRVVQATLADAFARLELRVPAFVAALGQL